MPSEEKPPESKPPEEKIDPRVFELYDEYCHGYIDRRTFLSRAAAITIGGVSALSMAQALLPRYSRGPDDLLHRPADQRDVRRVPVARR